MMKTKTDITRENKLEQKYSQSGRKRQKEGGSVDIYIHMSVLENLHNDRAG